MKKVIGFLLVLALVFTLAGPVAGMNGNGVEYYEDQGLYLMNETASNAAGNPITVAGD